MIPLQHKHKQFCQAFLKSFDFEFACEAAKVNKSKMLVLLYDSTSPVNHYINEQCDVYALQNSFITDDLIRFKLAEVLLNGENQHKIQASKLLLGMVDEADQSAVFKTLISALQEKK